MAANNLTRFKTVVLALSFVLITLTYIVFERGFVRCEKTGCKELDGDLISQVGTSGFQLSEASNTLKNKVEEAANKTALADKKAEESAELLDAVGETEKEIANAKVANISNTDINALGLKKDAYNANFQAANRQLTTLANRKAIAENELAAVREHITSRYSSRLMWIFYSAIFLLLCAAAVLFSAYVIWNAFEGKWIIFLPLVFLLSTGFAVYAYFSNYMWVIKPMYEQSIDKGDLPFGWINLSNVVGFAATIWLITASCSILYAVDNKLRAKSDENIADRLNELETEKINLTNLSASETDVDARALLDEKIISVNDRLAKLELSDYETWRQYLWVILVVGSLMLFVGVLRFDTLAKWHLSFVSYGQGSATAKILDGYLSTSLTLQAGYYSILLAVIYLPTSYWIWVKQGGDETEGNESWYSALSGYVTPFLTIVSPLLAKSFNEILTKLLGN